MTPSTSPADRSKLTRDSVGALLPGGTTTTDSTFNSPVGRGSDVRSCCCGMRQQLVQAAVGDAGADELLPGADRLLDRGERPAHHDGAGDDQAGRDLLMDGKPGAAA